MTNLKEQLFIEWMLSGVILVLLCDGTLRFAHLCKVACLVLLIPHSNAEEERVFSMIRKNKTDFRNRLSLNADFHQF